MGSCPFVWLFIVLSIRKCVDSHSHSIRSASIYLCPDEEPISHTFARLSLFSFRLARQSAISILSHSLVYDDILSCQFHLIACSIIRPCMLHFYYDLSSLTKSLVQKCETCESNSLLDRCSPPIRILRWLTNPISIHKLSSIREFNVILFGPPIPPIQLHSNSMKTNDPFANKETTWRIIAVYACISRNAWPANPLSVSLCVWAGNSIRSAHSGDRCSQQIVNYFLPRTLNANSIYVTNLIENNRAFEREALVRVESKWDLLKSHFHRNANDPCLLKQHIWTDSTPSPCIFIEPTYSFGCTDFIILFSDASNERYPKITWQN